MIPPACLIGFNLAAFHDDAAPRDGSARSPWAWLRREPAVLGLIVVPVFLAGWAAGEVTPNDLRDQQFLAHRIAALNATMVQERIESQNAPEPEMRTEWATELAKSEAQMEGLRARMKTSSEIFFRDSRRFAAALALMVLLVSMIARLDRSWYAEASGVWRSIKPIRAYAWVLGVCAMASVAASALDYFWLKLVHGKRSRVSRHAAKPQLRRDSGHCPARLLRGPSHAPRNPHAERAGVSASVIGRRLPVHGAARPEVSR